MEDALRDQLGLNSSSSSSEEQEQELLELFADRDQVGGGGTH